MTRYGTTLAAAFVVLATAASAQVQKKDIDIKASDGVNLKAPIKIYAGTEHGVPMFVKNPELEPMIVAWVKGQLLPKGGTR
jgi:hypothetical protein